MSFFAQSNNEEVEQEIGEEDKSSESKENKEDDDDVVFEEVNVSFACEDCDYRWESAFESDEDADEVQYCPMCGTANTTQI
ncbi:MAG: hypothetical protein ABUK01_14220 [Leptospirales bacterium]